MRSRWLLAAAAALTLAAAAPAVADVLQGTDLNDFVVGTAGADQIFGKDGDDTLYGLGDRRRALLYIAAGIITVTLTATSRLWDTGFGEVLWVVLIAAAVYAAFAVFRSTRKY